MPTECLFNQETPILESAKFCAGEEPIRYLCKNLGLTSLRNLLIIPRDRPAIPGNVKPSQWFVEDHWEIEDPLWRAALNVSNSDPTCLTERTKS